ncbi:acyltransferase family protein [Aerococcus sp. UMB7834]|uniref:acyltransferase family protein n=1 Tax=Aerococcus sp. UMB7834 TaxID=3046342 RepID=UPI00254F52ED|nr:acyltransferase family protein [Aerococcus sp. UMB7834]MDK6805541.1 acyltransferase family protein [Aerococcus sp. UMB7834]
MSKRKYFRPFDSLRFLSMLAIIFYHYTKHLLPGGFLAVDIFFILSAFLISGRLERGYQMTGEFPRFWSTFFRRLGRLFRPMLFVLVVGTCYLLVFRFDLLTNLPRMFFSSLVFVNNWSQILAGGSYFADFAHPSIFTHLWYLSMYAQFLFLWPALVRLIRPHLKSAKGASCFYLILAVLSAILMAVLFDPGKDPSRVYYGTDTRLFSFALGAAAGTMMQTDKFRQIIKKGATWLTSLLTLGIGGLIFFMMRYLTDSWSLTYYGGMFVFDLLVLAFMVLLTLPGNLIAKLLRFRPLSWLGQMTYGMYLFYYPVFIIFRSAPKSSNFFVSSIAWQLALIIFLGALTHIVVVHRKAYVPIFNRPKGVPLQLKSGFRAALSSDTSLASRIAFWAYLAMLVGTGVALALAPIEHETADQIRQAEEQKAALKKQNQAIAQGNVSDPASEEEIKAYIDQLPADQQGFLSSLPKEQVQMAHNLQATFIGDSLLLGASEVLSITYPNSYISAEVGRQVYAIAPVIEQLKANQALFNPVVINLGANGGFSSQQIVDMVEQIGKDRTIYLVNTHVNRPWRDEVNANLKTAADQLGDKVHYLDWNAYFNSQEAAPSWLGDDGVHFNDEGRKQWVAFVTRAIYESEHQELPEDQGKKSQD